MGVQLPDDRHRSSLPEGSKAHRIFLLLQEDIAQGALAPDAALPGELRLAQDYGVSRVTIRRALEALEAQGLIERRAGSGTVVRSRPGDGVRLAGDLATMMPQLMEMGQTTEARLIDFSYTPPVPSVARALGLGPDDQVQRAVRVRLVEGLPFSHLTTHVPADIAAHYSEADLATTPLLRLMERGGVRIGHAEQEVSATLAAPQVAEALETEVGAALIALTRIVRDEDGRGVEHLSALYRPDRFRLRMELDRVGAGESRHWAPSVTASRRAAE
ncbi:MAG: transcriptional regulator, GntR family [Rhodobacteraceae bacterium HLUCCA24]|nr:MAG: transcriptional regulator, GntR family [Rhodobacteraceae bacterium HLUCCA24]